MKYVADVILIVVVTCWLYVFVKHLIIDKIKKKQKQRLKNWETMNDEELKDPTWEIELPMFTTQNGNLKLCKFGKNDKKGQVISMSRQEFKELIKFIERIK